MPGLSSVCVYKRNTSKLNPIANIILYFLEVKEALTLMFHLVGYSNQVNIVVLPAHCCRVVPQGYPIHLWSLHLANIVQKQKWNIKLSTQSGRRRCIPCPLKVGTYWMCWPCVWGTRTALDGQKSSGMWFLHKEAFLIVHSNYFGPMWVTNMLSMLALKSLSLMSAYIIPFWLKNCFLCDFVDGQDM